MPALPPACPPPRTLLSQAALHRWGRSLTLQVGGSTASDRRRCRFNVGLGNPRPTPAYASPNSRKSDPVLPPVYQHLVVRFTGNRIHARHRPHPGLLTLPKAYTSFQCRLAGDFRKEPLGLTATLDKPSSIFLCCFISLLSALPPACLPARPPAHLRLAVPDISKLLQMKSCQADIGQWVHTRHKDNCSTAS